MTPLQRLHIAALTDKATWTPTTVHVDRSGVARVVYDDMPPPLVRVSLAKPLPVRVSQ